MLLTSLVGAALLSAVNGDVYMQSCRGGNNRLDENNRDRTNDNRLFDSQNNDRGGVNVGHLTYYTGETVPISWTNQHGAGRYQLKESELILQYTCDPLMRDGSTTNRIEDEPSECENWNCDTDVEYGRHESWASYQYCKASSRNKGLFTANQNLNNKYSAVYTRQDNDGTRYGFECPEERDYYPYWRGSMWRDMAIFTNTPERCAAYKSESQNVKGRWECRYSDRYWTEQLEGYVPQRSGELSLDENECIATSGFLDEETGESYDKWAWVQVPSHGIGEPDCLQSVTTRANHHGLPGGRSFWTYKWTVPDSILDMDGHDSCCVIRLRYNITTNDYPAWDSDQGIGAGVDYRNNSLEENPNANDDPAWLTIWENFAMNYTDIEYSFQGDNDDNEQRLSRGYVFRNDPEVDVFGFEPWAPDGDESHASRLLLQLAIATDQFGRTFEDRTHCFTVKDRADAGIRGKGATSSITLVTVQGKRGNIVQTYPATEYFFIPEPAMVYQNSYVHFCWTGSNSNPGNNAGQGQAGSDRHNLCPLTQPQWDKEDQTPEMAAYGEVDGNVATRNGGAVGDLGNNYPDWIREPSYGMPVYYNYAHKRDLPRRSASSGHVSGRAKQWWQDNRDTYPYNDPYNAYYFKERGRVSQMAGLDTSVLAALCTLRKQDFGSDSSLGTFDYGNMQEMDDAGTTFCIEPIRVKELGTWNFIATRSNNFSNRSQKGTLIVSNAFSEAVSINSDGYSSPLVNGQARVVVLPEFVLDGNSLDLTITTWLNRGETSTIVQLSGADGGAFTTESLSEQGFIEIWIPYTPKSLSRPKVWHRFAPEDDWSEHSKASPEYDAKTHFAVVQVQDGGYYTVSNEPEPLAYAACILGALLFCTSFAFVAKKNCVRK